MQRLLLSSGVQPKLTINQPGDVYEQEADRVADAVMRMPEPGEEASAIMSLSPSGLQRKCAACEAGGATCAGCAEEEEHVQRQAEDAGPAPELEASPIPRSDGQPLSAPVRGFFESRFGRDFSNVRVHTGAEADTSARSIRALAYTHHSDIVFRSGQYSPDTAAGRRLLAHELTHVVQQGGGGSSAIQRACTHADKTGLQPPAKQEAPQGAAPQGPAAEPGVIQRQAEDAGQASAAEESPVPEYVKPIRPWLCPDGFVSCSKRCSADAFDRWIDCFEKNVRGKEGKEYDDARQKCNKESDDWERDCILVRCRDCL